MEVVVMIEVVVVMVVRRDDGDGYFTSDLLF